MEESKKRIPTVLHVAEKPSIATAVAEILGRHDASFRSMPGRSPPLYFFQAPFLGQTCFHKVPRDAVDHMLAWPGTNPDLVLAPPPLPYCRSHSLHP
jgi:hypothetical protein